MRVERDAPLTSRVWPRGKKSLGSEVPGQGVNGQESDPSGVHDLVVDLLQLGLVFVFLVGEELE